MANICFNYIEVYGDADTLARIIADPSNEEFYFEFVGENLISTMESKWIPPKDLLQELSKKFGVGVECEYEECGCDIGGKFDYQSGELIFKIEMPYLEWKYNSLDWNEFIGCEVEWRLEEDFELEDFLCEFEGFCSDEEMIELTKLYNEG